MTDAKLISYTINDFSTEIEMESFLLLMEKHEDELFVIFLLMYMYS